MKLVLSDRARRDLFHQLEWLAQRSPSALRKASDQVEQTFLRLLEFPEMGMLQEEGFREAPVRFGKNGFIVRYQVVIDVLIVLRFFHASQNR